MENELIMLDTSVLIDYFRKTNKENSLLFKISGPFTQFSVSIITEFEILIGCNDKQQNFGSPMNLVELKENRLKFEF